ncbi:MAG: hypothetical protein ACI9EW_002865, partial [Cellvibrionaceae bacterium]
MNHTASSPLAVGFYGQIYNEIVRPNQIWRVSRYFIRRWGPILEPSRFWAVVAARHLSYLSEEQGGNFKAWDNEIAGEANLSNSHYRRLKGEMGDGNGPLSLFLKKGSLSYINKGDGRVRKGRTRYNVRLDDPLTPADARQVETALRAAGINRSTQPEEIVNILKECRELEKSSHFYAAESELTSAVYGGWQAIYVTDIVEAITSKKLSQHVAVAEQAEAFHSWLTAGDVIGRRYFRNSWLPVVGAGPAWLLTWLRSYCFLDETTGEIRDELSLSKIELAARLGIHKNALNRWLKALEQIPDQPFKFVEELGRIKQPDNSVLVTFKIGMFEPLTAVDLERFDDLTEGEAEGEIRVESRKEEREKEGEMAPVQNERYEPVLILTPTHTDERYKMGETPVMDGGAVQNERYSVETSILSAHMNERGDSPSARNERNSVTQMNGAAHTIEQNTILAVEQGPQMNGGASSIEPVSASKRDHLFKHLKNLSTLTKDLEPSDLALLQAAGSGMGADSGNEPVAQTLFGGPAEFLRSIGADPGGSLTQQLLRAEVPLTTLAAWWLYALSEPGIRQPVPFVLKRASGGHIAPEKFVQLAKMGLDEWITHMLAFELGLPNELPGRDLWESAYADYSPEVVPFIGPLVCRVLDRMTERGASG